MIRVGWLLALLAHCSPVHRFHELQWVILTHSIGLLKLFRLMLYILSDVLVFEKLHANISKNTPLKPNMLGLNWVEGTLFLCACMREATSLFSVSFACKHACVHEARAGRATDSEEECQVDCDRGCVAR